MHFSKSKIKQLQKEEICLLEQVNSLRGGENGRTRMTRLKRPGEPAHMVPLFGCKNALAAPRSQFYEKSCVTILEGSQLTEP